MNKTLEMPPEIRAALIIESRRMTNMPHPDSPGMRIVGWIVDESVAGLTESHTALSIIADRAKFTW